MFKQILREKTKNVPWHYWLVGLSALSLILALAIIFIKNKVNQSAPSEIEIINKQFPDAKTSPPIFK